MEESQFTRTAMLLGEAAISKLRQSRVAVFGVGGVGGYVVEVLARSGIGTLHLIDNDQVSITNLNRQLVALHSTIGQYKVDVAAQRIQDINPDCHVVTHRMFYLPENADDIDLTQFDYVVDCIDTVAAKVELARRCYEAKIPLLCCMGAANKLDPTAFRVTDISKTQMDPLARVMRRKLKDLHIPHLKCVWSDEQPVCHTTPPASNAFVPAAAGLVAGGQVVKDLIAY